MIGRQVNKGGQIGQVRCVRVRVRTVGGYHAGQMGGGCGMGVADSAPQASAQDSMYNSIIQYQSAAAHDICAAPQATSHRMCVWRPRESEYAGGIVTSTLVPK